MWTYKLSVEQADQVRDLAARAVSADGVDPLNEEAHFALIDESAEHLLRYAGDELAGYLIWQPQHRTAQLVVDPAHRRKGIGSELLAALRDAAFGRSSGTEEADGRTSVPRASGAPLLNTPSRVAEAPWGLWAFGDLPAARGFAAHHGLASVRGLLIMERELGVEGLVGLGGLDTALRAYSTSEGGDSTNAGGGSTNEGGSYGTNEGGASGLTLRGFRPGDAEALLAVNAAAFAHHPEQGALDVAGLATRMAEDWFDPSGLILGWDSEGLAGFHWTKRVSAELGEVYVMAVAPRAQGRGYGKALLQAGLDHLARGGAQRILLYVDSADQVAVRMYESAGFQTTRRDLLYAPKTRRDHDHA